MRILFFILLTIICLTTQSNILGGDDHDEVAYKLRELRKILSEKNVQELQTYCQNLENYIKGGKQSFGGIHDYLDFNNPEKMIGWILDTCSRNENKNLLELTYFNDMIMTPKRTQILGGDNHDLIAHRLIELTGFLNQKTTDELKAICLNVESYMRRGVPMLGGIHDYIGRMDKDAMIKYILSNLLEDSNPQILDLETFKTLIVASQNPKVLLGGDNHDQIAFLRRKLLELKDEQLNYLCINLETKARGNGTPMVGGIHDSLRLMTISQKIDYIVGTIQKEKYENLLNFDELTKLSQPKKQVMFGEGDHDQIAHKVIQLRQNLEKLKTGELNTLCLALENKIRNGQMMLGGIHDRLGFMSDNEKINYILTQIQEQKDKSLFEFEELMKLTITQMTFLETSEFRGGDNHDRIAHKVIQLRQNLEKLKTEELNTLCLALEKEYRKKEGITQPLRGGIEDSLHSMSVDDKVQYILKSILEQKEYQLLEINNLNELPLKQMNFLF